MKIVIAPDSFKESLSAPQVAAAIARGWMAIYPEAECLLRPTADGGEGTVEALLAATGGERRECAVQGPLGTPVAAHWGLLADGTAVIEMAAASGLQLRHGRADRSGAGCRRLPDHSGPGRQCHQRWRQQPAFR